MSYKNELRERVGVNLVKLRKAHGLTQDHVAKVLGVSPGFLSQIESGKKPVPDELVKKLQDYFGFSTEQLLAGPDVEDEITPANIWTIIEQNSGDTRRELYEILKAYEGCSPEDRKRIYRMVGKVVMPPKKLTLTHLINIKGNIFSIEQTNPVSEPQETSTPNAEIKRPIRRGNSDFEQEEMEKQDKEQVKS